MCLYHEFNGGINIWLPRRWINDNDSIHTSFVIPVMRHELIPAEDSLVKTMMTSSNGNIFRVIGPLWREFTGHRWIPLTKASDAELWCFFLIFDRINSWVNNHEAGGLRHRRAHYDVIVMHYFVCVAATVRYPAPGTHGSVNELSGTFIKGQVVQPMLS